MHFLSAISDTGDSVSPVLVVTALIGALSASLVIAGALRTVLRRTFGRRRDRYGRLSRLGTGAQLPFFTSVLGEPPAVQHSVVKDDYMVPLERDDPDWDPDRYQLKAQPRAFLVSVFIDRDYYVQTISDDDQTVLAYSVTTRSRRFRSSLSPVLVFSRRQRLRLRRDRSFRRLQPRIVLGRTRFADLDATGPDPLRSASSSLAIRRPQLRLLRGRLLRPPRQVPVIRMERQ